MSTTLTDKNSNGFPARSGVAAGDFISSAEMNQHLDALGERTNYLYTMGIYPHNATFNYPIGAFCQVNGTVYRAQVENVGKPPASNPSFWVKCPMTKDEIIADVNLGSYATTAQMNTGLSSKQNTDATLTALANLTTAADQIPYATGADTFAMTPLTPFARTLLDDANAAAALATLGAVSRTELQNQSYISATTSGTAPAYAASITPAPTLAAGLRIRAKFHAATSAASTLNLNALGTKSIKQYDVYGSKVDAVIATNMLTDLEYDGVDFVVLNPIAPKKYMHSFGWNGYQSIGENMLEQWGTATTDANGICTITFPVSFSTDCVGVWCTHVGGEPVGFVEVTGSLSRTSVQVKVKNVPTGNPGAGWVVRWRALGNR